MYGQFGTEPNGRGMASILALIMRPLVISNRVIRQILSYFKGVGKGQTDNETNAMIFSNQLCWTSAVLLTSFECFVPYFPALIFVKNGMKHTSPFLLSSFMPISVLSVGSGPAF